MGKHEIIEDRPKPSAEAGTGHLPVSEAEPMPRMALVAVDAAKIEMPKLEKALEMPKVGIAIAEGPKIGLASIEAEPMAPGIEEAKRTPPEETADADADHAAAPAPAAGAPRVSRFTMLAASLALAAALGAMVGVLATCAFLRPAAVVGEGTGLEEVQALKENIVQARVELATLKVSVDSGIRNAGAQFTRLGERIERLERVQVEPVARLGKAIEALERLTRSEAAVHATGSISPPSAGMGALPAGAGVVDGWVVRDVHRGTALIEGRMGLIEVDKGDVVPGLGRVDGIRKQDGRWVVVTSRGLILSAR